MFVMNYLLIVFEEPTVCYLYYQMSKEGKINVESTYVSRLDGNIYASPTSGEAYRDRRLTTNF